MHYLGPQLHKDLRQTVYLDNRDDTKEGTQEFVDGKRDALREAKEKGHGPIVLGAIESGIEIGDLRKDSEDSDQ